MNPKLLQFSIFILFVSLAILTWVVIYEIKINGQKFRELTSTLNETAKDIREDIKPLGEYAKFQTLEFQSERNQKLVEHNLSIGKNAILLIQRIARTTVPRLNSNLDESERAIIALKILTQGLDKNVNVDILPEVTKILQRLDLLAEKLGVTVDDLNKAITVGLDRGILTLESLNKAITNVLENPDIPILLSEMKGAMTDVHGTTTSVNEGFKRFPSLMTNWEKYTKTATKYQKFIYLAQILNILAGIPRP